MTHENANRSMNGSANVQFDSSNRIRETICRIFCVMNFGGKKCVFFFVFFGNEMNVRRYLTLSFARSRTDDPDLLANLHSRLAIVHHTVVASLCGCGCFVETRRADDEVSKLRKWYDPLWEITVLFMSLGFADSTKRFKKMFSDHFRPIVCIVPSSAPTLYRYLVCFPFSVSYVCQCSLYSCCVSMVNVSRTPSVVLFHCLETKWMTIFYT